MRQRPIPFCVAVVPCACVRASVAPNHAPRSVCVASTRRRKHAVALLSCYGHVDRCDAHAILPLSKKDHDSSINRLRVPELELRFALDTEPDAHLRGVCDHDRVVTTSLLDSAVPTCHAPDAEHRHAAARFLAMRSAMLMPTSSVRGWIARSPTGSRWFQTRSCAGGHCAGQTPELI